MYDDLRAKPHAVSAKNDFVIHCIFYIKFESEDSSSKDAGDAGKSQNSILVTYTSV